MGQPGLGQRGRGDHLRRLGTHGTDANRISSAPSQVRFGAMARSGEQPKVERPRSPLVIAAFIAGALAGATLIILAVLTAIGWVPGVRRPDYGAAAAGDVAWLTRRSLAATRREAEVAEAALQASNKQAAAAEQALAAAQEQAKISERLVEATNKQAAIAQAQLVASWRPILADPLTVGLGKAPRSIEIRPTLDKPFDIHVALVNIGVGPAFVNQGLLSLGAAMNVTKDLGPKIVPPGGLVLLVFTLNPTAPEDIAITNGLGRGDELLAGALYKDISGEHAWRSRGRLVRAGTYDWNLVDVEVADIELRFLV